MPFKCHNRRRGLADATHDCAARRAEDAAHAPSWKASGASGRLSFARVLSFNPRRHGDELSISASHAVMHTLQHAAAGVRRSLFRAINVTNVKVDGTFGRVVPRESLLDYRKWLEADKMIISTNQHHRRSIAWLTTCLITEAEQI